jgi:Zn-dependent peptidase ImmA (M78 family)
MVQPIILAAVRAARRVLSDYPQFFKHPFMFNCEELLVHIIYKEDIILDSHSFLDDFCGMYLEDEFEKTLVYNSNIISTRRNFTIAHELGHYFLHRDLDIKFVDRSQDLVDSSVKEFEMQANAFAGNLIVPDEIIFGLLKNKHTFQHIKKQIAVSSECLTWRLIQYLQQYYNFNLAGASEIVQDYKDFSFAKKFKVNHKLSLIFGLNGRNNTEILHNLRNNKRPVYLVKDNEGKIIGSSNVNYNYW